MGSVLDADDVLELEITPNRPDCLSVYGVAREVHAATGAGLEPDPEGTIEHHHRAAITALHPGGTADIQKVIIARRLGAGRDEAEEAGRTPD